MKKVFKAVGKFILNILTKSNLGAFAPQLSSIVSLMSQAMPAVLYVASRTKNKPFNDIITWLHEDGLEGAETLLNGDEQTKHELYRRIAKSILLRTNKNIWVEYEDDIIDSAIQLAYSLAKAFKFNTKTLDTN